MIIENAARSRSSTLIVLCTLTILGSVFILLKDLVTYLILAESNSSRSNFGILFINVIYVSECLSCFGSIAGAVLMIGGKKSGLVVYQISSIFFIVLTIAFACFCFISIIGIAVGLLQIVYLIPSILFYALYRNHEKYLS